jgi:V8-like Glu-specific endopeptidase
MSAHGGAVTGRVAVSLRSYARRAGRGGRFVVVITACALALGISVIAARASGANAVLPRGGGPGVTAVAHQVSVAGQRETLAYWTPARMAAAQSAALPRAVSPAVVPPKGIPFPVRYNGIPTTGALFYTTTSGAGTQQHFCSASVVNSTAGDLVLTAAHCVYSTKFVKNLEYVPDYHLGLQPYGAWAVGVITVAARWKQSHDPDLDFAFLTVSSPTGHKIQAVTGGLTPGFTRWYQQTVEVIGYNDTDHRPIRCLTKSFRFRVGQMEFYCHGYWTGTSGGPWIVGYNAKTGTGTVVGAIGGYEEGGKYAWASYSSYFGPKFRTLYNQAVKAATPTPSPSPSPSSSATSTPTPTAS